MDNALWMITVAPHSGRTPVVRCVEMEGPHPFAVSVTAGSFDDLPDLLTDARRQLAGLREGAAV